ncbi:HEAT repeat domain containing protein [Entamoeba histolytica HM-3:IMSS]|uniref:HEAT repeat domain containing protein n=2 Tax=Entamoeba histolytica TaxID=5759 RepID=M2RGS5_ENTHI|nr:HEAT repeat domain containing protein [Entamoeba histolytica KU27]EMS17845.1 HEAT repeat domain containing protein [Entamoeba histolytica HM-3:IMSS]
MKLFKAFVGPSLPYESQEKQETITENNFTYTVYHAKKVSDKKNISLFEFPSSNPRILNENVLKRFRTLKHPNIINYLDHVVNDRTTVILTEEVYPLTSFLQSSKCNEDMVLWGLFSLANAIHFLNITAKLGHYNITKNSIFVTKSGEWKLGGLQYVTQLGQLGDFKTYIESNRSIGHLPNDSSSEYVDSYSFSKLASQVYPNPPAPLQALISSLASQPITSFLTHPSVSTPFLTIVYNMDNYSALDDFTRRSFLSSITKTSLPSLFCRYKLLPFYIDLFRSNMPEASCAVESLLKVSSGLEQDEFVQQVQNYIPKFINSSDLQTKYSALGSLRYCSQHITPSFAESLFPSIIQCTNHQNDKIRDAGIRALLVLVEKVNKSKQLECANRFEKALGDPSLIVRTNTVVCISKSCSFFTVETRKRLLLCSIARSGKDAVKEMRIAIINGIKDNINDFSANDSARNILPYISVFLVDDHKNVRNKARELFSSLTETVLKYSEQLDNQQQEQKPEEQKQEVKETPHLNLKKPADVIYDQQKPVQKVNIDLWNVSPQRSNAVTPQQNPEDVFTLFEEIDPEFPSQQQKTNDNQSVNTHQNNTTKEDDDIERLTKMIGKKSSTSQSKTFQKADQKQRQLKEIGLPENFQNKTQNKTTVLLKEKPTSKPEIINETKVQQKQQNDVFGWGISNEANDAYWDEWAGALNSKDKKSQGDSSSTIFF